MEDVIAASLDEHDVVRRRCERRVQVGSHLVDLRAEATAVVNHDLRPRTRSKYAWREREYGHRDRMDCSRWCTQGSNCRRRRGCAAAGWPRRRRRGWSRSRARHHQLRLRVLDEVGGGAYLVARLSTEPVGRGEAEAEAEEGEAEEGEAEEGDEGDEGDITSSTAWSIATSSGAVATSTASFESSSGAAEAAPRRMTSAAAMTRGGTQKNIAFLVDRYAPI